MAPSSSRRSENDDDDFLDEEALRQQAKARIQQHELNAQQTAAMEKISKAVASSVLRRFSTQVVDHGEQTSHQPMTRAQRRWAMVRNVARRMDRDGSGTIEFTEFMATLLPSGMSYEQLEKCWSSMMGEDKHEGSADPHLLEESTLSLLSTERMRTLAGMGPTFEESRPFLLFRTHGAVITPEKGGRHGIECPPPPGDVVIWPNETGIPALVARVRMAGLLDTEQRVNVEKEVARRPTQRHSPTIYPISPLALCARAIPAMCLATRCPPEPLVRPTHRWPSPLLNC
jgi:hypothetical protein